MITVGNLWCFLLRTGMDHKKSIRKTYTVADILGETGEKGKQQQKTYRQNAYFLRDMRTVLGNGWGCWFKGLPAEAR